MAGLIMSADAFWLGTELDSYFTKRGSKLKAIRDALEDHKGDRSVWQSGELNGLADAIAIYASAKDWKGAGKIGTRDLTDTISNLVKEIDAHLWEHKLQPIRTRIGLPELSPPTTRRIPPPPPSGSSRPGGPTLPTTSSTAPVANRMPPGGIPMPGGGRPMGPSSSTPVANRTTPGTPPPRSGPPPRPGGPPPSSSNSSTPIRSVPLPPPTTSTSQVVSVPVPKKKAQTSSEAIEKCRKGLDLAKQFGCRDVVAFFQCVKGYEPLPKLPSGQRPPDKAPPKGDPKRDAWFARHNAPFKQIWDRGSAAGGGNMSLAAPINDPFVWNAKKLEQAYSQVVASQAAECTSFGLYAAHLLTTTDSSKTPRVELVSWIGRGGVSHVYCVVNRDGKYSKEDKDGKTRFKLPPKGEWTGKWWIVDPWAASLGHECIFEGGNGYPLSGMLDPLYLNMVYDE